MEFNRGCSKKKKIEVQIENAQVPWRHWCS